MTTLKVIGATVGYLAVALPLLWFGCWRPCLRATRKHRQQ